MKTTAALEKEVQTLKAANAKQAAEIARMEAETAKMSSRASRMQAEIERLKEDLRLAILRKFGKASEKLVGQIDLPFEEMEPLAEAAVEEEPASTVVDAHERRKPGRKPLDPSLPQIDFTFELSPEERRCACGHEMDPIGEEVTKRLNVIPEQLFVEVHHRCKYACRHCQGLADETTGAVKIAPGRPSLNPGSIITPGLLAFSLTQKYCDHLPFYRQEQRFERIGVHLPRQNLWNWQADFTKRLDPLFTLFDTHLKSHDLLQMDETHVTLQKMEGRPNGSKGYMWLAKGGPPKQPVVLYRFAPSRGAAVARSFLEGFEGWLQADGFEAYVAAILGLSILLAGCWAHTRRKFFEADKVARSKQTQEALRRIQELYRLHANLQDQNLPRDEFQQKRRDVIGPKMEAFFDWVRDASTRMMPSSAAGKALAYTLNQEDKLRRVLDHPDMTLDNNGAENAIRPFVLGRKNWLFSGNEEGAASSCRVFSLIETAKLNGLNPYDYLYRVAEALPQVEVSGDWATLLPWNLPKTRLDPRDYLRGN